MIESFVGIKCFWKVERNGVKGEFRSVGTQSPQDRTLTLNVRKFALVEMDVAFDSANDSQGTLFESRCCAQNSSDNCILHHDNAPAHSAFLVREFLAKEFIPMLPQPSLLSYSSVCSATFLIAEDENEGRSEAIILKTKDCDLLYEKY